MEVVMVVVAVVVMGAMRSSPVKSRAILKSIDPEYVLLCSH